MNRAKTPSPKRGVSASTPRVDAVLADACLRPESPAPAIKPTNTSAARTTGARVRDFDFDMVVSSWGQSLSPGNEQRDFWGSRAADLPGSRNIVGIKNPAIDPLIEAIIQAPDRAALITRVRALDRVLLWNHFVIPHWHIPYDRIAYWDKFGQPGMTPLQGTQLSSWWVDPQKAAALEQRRAGGPK